MTDKVLEARVKRLENKLDQVIEQDHEHLKHLKHLTQLEEALASFIKSNQNGFAKLQSEQTKSQQCWRPEMATSANCEDASFAQLRQQMLHMSDRIGSLEEDFVAPRLPEILSEVATCPAEQEVAVNIRIRRRHPTQPGKILKIDAMADCGNYVLFNETKSQLTLKIIQTFLEKLAVIRDYFPEYQHHTILGSVAALAVEASLIEYASRQGLFVLGSGGGLMTLQNAPGFTWRAF